MKMNSSIPKSVLFDFFEGRATTMQRKMIEEWLGNPQNEVLFFQWLNEWESQHPQYMPNTERALQDFKILLDDATPPAIRPLSLEVEYNEPKVLWKKWILAASILLLLGISVVFFQRDIRYEHFQTGNAKTQTLRLSDGTVVTLNANSSLFVPRWGFAKTHRQVVLEGEAEFVVSHTSDNKRFIVQTNDDFNVEVLGTEFVMFSRKRGKKVILNKGSVKVHYEAGKQLAMKPGDIVTYTTQNNHPELLKTQGTQPHNAWKNHQFYFDNTPLWEVAQVIEEHFGVEVVLTDSSLNQRRLSGYFKADTPKDVAETISLLLTISIEQNGQKIIIHNPSTKNL